MENIKKREKVFEITCPYCGGRLWVDSELQEIIQSEKGAKKKASFDELLLKEKKKAEEIGQKFEATAELRQKKLEKAKAAFEKALSDLDEFDVDEEPDKKDSE
jgi:Zn-finger nucleic acid-binding protein